MADTEKEYPDLNPALEVDTDDMIIVKEHSLEAGEKVSRSSFLFSE